MKKIIFCAKFFNHAGNFDRSNIDSVKTAIDENFIIFVI